MLANWLNFNFFTNVRLFNFRMFFIKYPCLLLLWSILFEKQQVEGPWPFFWSKSSEAESSSNNWFYRCDNILMTEKMLADLGQQLQKEGNYQAAVDCYSRAIEKNYNQVEYYRLRGKCYVRLENWTKAITDYRRTLIINPTNDDDRFFLACIMFDAKRFADASQEILISNNTEKIVNFGDKLITEKRYEEALRCYTSAIDRKPSAVTYYMKRIECYKLMNNIEGVITDLSQLIQIRPFDLEHKINLSEILAEDEKYNEAREVLTYIDTTDMTEDSIARIVRARKKIKEIKKKKRLERLFDYMKSLIVQDAIRRTNEIETNSGIYYRNVKLENRRKEIEWIRDVYLRKLERAFKEYNSFNKSNEERKLNWFSTFSKKCMNFFKNLIICTGGFDLFDGEESKSSEFPDFLVDGISFDLMTEPVITPGGHTYDRSTISRFLRDHTNDPITNRPLSINDLIPNLAVAEAIDLYKEQEREYVKTKRSLSRKFNLQYTACTHICTRSVMKFLIVLLLANCAFMLSEVYGKDGADDQNDGPQNGCGSGEVGPVGGGGDFQDSQRNIDRGGDLGESGEYARRFMGPGK